MTLIKTGQVRVAIAHGGFRTIKSVKTAKIAFVGWEYLLF